MEWEGYWHTNFEERYLELVRLVKAKMIADPDYFDESLIYKFFECVNDTIDNRILINPTQKDFLLGKTLGEKNKSWRRAKKGLPQRYRLFFKFSTEKNSVVLAWLNDEDTLRKAGAKTDVYEVFKKMLKNGTIPNSYEELLEESSKLNKAN